MQPGQLLRDAQNGVARFRVERFLTEGKHYQIALGHDTQLDDKLVCLKAIDYATSMLADAAYVEGRRAALREELAFLTLASHLIPEPLDLLQLEGSPAGGLEPVLVYEYQHGDTLYELVTQRAPQGLEPKRALAIWRELVLFCQEIHAQGYIFRDFDPRHIIVGLDDVVQMVGCGNAVQRDEKLNIYKAQTNPAYTAPEIRRELTGAVVKPACDFYSLGALLSFMLTGIEPTPVAESPLDADAYDQLRERIAPGYRLLIARCLQPLAKKRFGNAAELLPYCSPETLPTATSEGFGLLDLPAPWSGPEGMDNRALRSKISPGPLVSAKGEVGGVAAAATAAPATPPPHLEPAASTALATQQPGALEAKQDTSRRTMLIVGAIVGLGLFILLILAAIVIAVLQRS